MMRHISGLVVLLILAVLFAAGMVYVRSKPPQIEDPVADAVKQLSDTFGLEVTGAPEAGTSGLTVEKVQSGSSGERLGLKVGDHLVAVNDRSIWHAKNLVDLLSEAMKTGPVSLLVEKDGAYRQVILAGRRAPGGGMAGPGGGRRGVAGRGPAAVPGRSP